MTAPALALVACPACDGRGEIGTHQDYFGNWDTEQCRACEGMAEVSADGADALLAERDAS